MRTLALELALLAAVGFIAPARVVRGEVPPDSETFPLVHETIIQARPSEVWKVWSTSEGFKALGVAKAEMDFRVGGIIRSHYRPEGVLGDAGTIENEILAFEPERMIAFRIHKTPRGFPFPNAWKSTWSVVTLTDLGDGRTHLRLAGMGYTGDGESQAMRRFFDTGNASSLRVLASRFDGAGGTKSEVAGHSEPPLSPVDLEGLIPGSREDVYRAYTTADGWKSFLGATARIEARPGGPFELRFDPAAPAGQQGSEGCTVLSLVPGEMLSHTWNAPPKFPHAREKHTWVVVTFESVSAKLTRVRLRHLGFAERAEETPELADEFRQTRAYFAGAWKKVLGALRDRFEKGSEPAGKRP